MITLRNLPADVGLTDDQIAARRKLTLLREPIAFVTVEDYGEPIGFLQSIPGQPDPVRAHLVAEAILATARELRAQPDWFPSPSQERELLKLVDLAVSLALRSSAPPAQRDRALAHSCAVAVRMLAAKIPPPLPLHVN